MNGAGPSPPKMLAFIHFTKFDCISNTITPIAMLNHASGPTDAGRPAPTSAGGPCFSRSIGAPGRSPPLDGVGTFDKSMIDLQRHSIFPGSLDRRPSLARISPARANAKHKITYV